MSPTPFPSITAARRRLWGGRPSVYSRTLWALMMLLDLLPWPWGEDILAWSFALFGLLRPSRRRRARAWAAGQATRHPLWLAMRVSAFRGRWVARASLLGVRGVDHFRRDVVLRGETHLTETRGTILLGFHLGPPLVDVALRIFGYPVAWVGTARVARAWSREPWRSLVDPRDNLAPPADRRFWPGYLYRARRILLDGGSVFIMADSWAGRPLLTVPVPGGDTVIRSGWLMLQRQTGARVVPVSTHLEGRTQVITVHPPVPVSDDPAKDERRWGEILTALITDYVRRFPEQCPVLAFPVVVARPARPPRAVPDAPPLAGAGSPSATNSTL